MKIRTMNEAFKLQTQKRSNKNTFKLGFFWLKFILILALLVTTIVFIALSPLFNIKTIEASGTTKYKNDTLAGLSGIKTAENGFKQLGYSPASILTLRFGNAENILRKECPYIKDVKVRYVLPSGIAISIVERTVFAAVPYLGTSLVIDDDGFVLETLSADEEKKIPVLKGLKFDNYELGGKLAVKNPEALQTARKLIDAVRQSDKNDAVHLFDQIDSIYAGDPAHIGISLDSRVTADLGDLQDLNYRISATKTVFYKNIKKNERGVLDFSLGEKPVFQPESRGKE